MARERTKALFAVALLMLFLLGLATLAISSFGGSGVAPKADPPVCPEGWRLHDIDPPSSSALLHDVEMISRDDGWAVGIDYQNDRPLILRWDGVRWNSVDNAPIEGGELSAVSGSSSGDLWAVGNASGVMPLILHFDGRHWQRVDDVPNPGGPSGIGLHSLTRVSSREVWAFGSFGVIDKTTSASVPLALKWNGRTWTRSRVGGRGYLAGSVAAGGRLWAVGSARPSTSKAAPPPAALAVRAEGSRWIEVEVDKKRHTLSAVTAKDEFLFAVAGSNRKSSVLRHDGSGWITIDDVAKSRLSDIAPQGGSLWAAGSRKDAPLILRKTNGTWVAHDLPPTPLARGGVRALDPGENGRLWAVGDTSNVKETQRKPLILEYCP